MEPHSFIGLLIIDMINQFIFGHGVVIYMCSLLCDFLIDIFAYIGVCDAQCVFVHKQLFKIMLKF